MQHETTGAPPLLNILLVAITAFMGAVADLVPYIDLILGIITKLVSIASFIVLLTLNYERIILNLRKIFRW